MTQPPTRIAQDHAGQSAGAKPPSRRRRILWLVLIVVVLGAGLLWLRGAPEPGAAADGATQPEDAPELVLQLLPSELHEVVQGGLRDTVQITGSLVPGRELTIAAEIPGRIETVAVREGEAVSAGQSLIRFDIDTLRNALEQQQATAQATLAQLELARAQLRRTTDLVGRGVTSASALETETANVAQLEASHAALLRQVASAEDDLLKAQVSAPFAGIINARSVNAGAYVAAGTEMLELVDISELVLEGGVPVTYAPRLKIGQRLTIQVDGIGERRFEGVIGRIAPVAVPGTRVLPVYASVENGHDLLRGGMFASGDLVLEEQDDAIGIPSTAILKDGDETYVLRLEGDRVARRPVTIARTWDRGRITQITEGLAPGDVIVAVPLERLSDGMRVARIGA